MVKKNKRQQSIKTKLIAAIAMLLVSSIMMVSSTYAWFTLSTAPEVTGITTSVGANGSLEMALMPTSGATADITTYVGSSFETTGDPLKTNVTWGNLVDLTSENYGMQKITLFPSALNAATTDENGNPLTLAEALLVTPAYGADGRVTELLANTVTSSYNYTDGNFPGNDEYGVRGVGVASGMTDRQLAYRNARSSAGTAMAQAKNAASTSLKTNGNALANIAITHGTNKSATHTQADVTALLAIVNDLLGTDSTTGVLEYIEEAYIQYILAYGASKASVEAGMDDTKFLAFQTAVEGAEDLDAVMDLLDDHGVTLPDAATIPINALATTRSNVEEAQTKLNALVGTGDDIAWSSISPALYLLADTDAMEINGIPATDIMDRVNDLVQSIGGGLTVTMATGGGVYADVADHCGNYNASIVIKEISYGTLNVTDMPARMATATTVSPVYLDALGTAVATAAAPETETGTVMPITDMYGYIVDLAFRTNASESNLLLQSEAVDRIYSENGAGAETMGHGSTMTFKATTTDFTDDKVISLMNSVRIVFFDPSGRAVLATAKLDTANVENTADGIIANIYLYTMEVGETTYEVAADGEYALVDGAYVKYAELADPSTYTGDRYNAVAGAITETRLEDTDAIITALTQGQAQAVSVLVYLDGATITNADVAATASTSVTGSMNLQFASSATLVPMEYTDLMDQGAADETTSATTTPVVGG